MAVFRIPVRTTPNAYTMTVELDGLFYDLTFRYNLRDAHWYMNINHNDVVVINGLKIVHSADLLAQFPHFVVDDLLPPGTLEVRDVAGSDRDPDRTTFGDDVFMLYTEAS